MSGGLRFRSETQLFSSKSSNLAVGTTVIVAASALVGVQRAAIYRYRIEAIGAATYQFQDTSGNALSAIYSLAALQVDRDTMAVNCDPLWATATSGVGLQLVVGGTGPVAADIWWAAGA